MDLSAGSIPCLHVYLDGVARVHRQYQFLYNLRTKRMNIKKAVELNDVVDAYARYAVEIVVGVGVDVGVIDVVGVDVGAGVDVSFGAPVVGNDFDFVIVYCSNSGSSIFFITCSITYSD